ncbi:hypothetical protein HanRHA438_Chr04g0179661 [Helianthus annuus]|nr:hypothetical protein HanRHA438_Chr04g0179661 [Helianthus annuus]
MVMRLLHLHHQQLAGRSQRTSTQLFLRLLSPNLLLVETMLSKAQKARLGARAQRGAPIAPGGSLGAKMGFF